MTDFSSPAFISNHWLPAAQLEVSGVHQQWLLSTDSMTARLQALGNFSVRSLNEYRSPLSADEAAFLDLPSTSSALVRETLLCVDAVPCVLARSLFPTTSLTHGNEVLISLAARPLGSELFREPVAERRLMQACWLEAAQLPAQLNANHELLLARRSLFIKHGLPLLVAECFLPGLWQRLV